MSVAATFSPSLDSKIRSHDAAIRAWLGGNVEFAWQSDVERWEGQRAVLKCWLRGRENIFLRELIGYSEFASEELLRDRLDRMRENLGRIEPWAEHVAKLLQQLWEWAGSDLKDLNPQRGSYWQEEPSFRYETQTIQFLRGTEIVQVVPDRPWIIGAACLAEIRSSDGDEHLLSLEGVEWRILPDPPETKQIPLTRELFGALVRSSFHEQSA